MPVEWHVLAPDLKFRRNDDGKIIMRLGGEQTYITVERWCALVACMSANGATPETAQRALALHWSKPGPKAA